MVTDISPLLYKRGHVELVRPTALRSSVARYLRIATRVERARAGWWRDMAARLLVELLLALVQLVARERLLLLDLVGHVVAHDVRRASLGRIRLQVGCAAETRRLLWRRNVVLGRVRPARSEPRRSAETHDDVRQQQHALDRELLVAFVAHCARKRPSASSEQVQQNKETVRTGFLLEGGDCGRLCSSSHVSCSQPASQGGPHGIAAHRFFLKRNR